MRFIAVCGGRDFRDSDLLVDVLDQEFKPGDVLITGLARGADSLARFYAFSNGIQVVDVPAMWDNFGKGAGFKRNAVIASLPLSLLIAFQGGNGTAHMIKCARDKGIEVLEAKRV